MKKQISFIVFVLALIAALSFSVFASEPVSVEADELSDITTAITNASDGDTLNITLSADIEFDQTISIDKAIMVNLTFGGYQLNYTGTAGASTNTAGISVNNVGAVLSLKGNNPLADYKAYTHYADTVKADMVGTGNLLCIVNGKLNVKDAYLFATNNTFVIYSAFLANVDQTVTVDGSVLRVNEGATTSAVCYRGGNANNNDVKNRILVLKNSVEYGGFFGADYNFNVLAGTKFTNVKFYDFQVKNDCWYNPDNASVKPLLMVSFEKALPITSCVFNNYDESLGAIKLYTETAKQNLKLYDCEFTSLQKATFGGVQKFSGDRAGNARVYIVEKQATCMENGSMYYYNNGFDESNKSASEATTATHDLGEEVVYYDNGYTEIGLGKQTCLFCKDLFETGNAFDPIFENQGYALNAAGDSVVLGTKINDEAKEAFLSTNPGATLDYGILVGRTNVSVSVENGAVAITDGYLYSCTDTTAKIVDLKVINFKDETKDLKFAMEFYVYDGAEITYTEPELDVISFNEIELSLNEDYIKMEELLESKHKLYYNDDGSFKVMVLADLHVQSGSDTTQIKERIKMLVDKENPDLIVFTGDNTIKASSEAALKTCLDNIVGYIEEKQIPWCHVYGNHDQEGALSKDAQQKVYESYEYCISKDVEELTGVGNYVHGIYNQDGSLGSVIYFLDSGTSNSTYTYDYIQDDQIAWYKETSELLQKCNDGEIVKGMMAFHIPLIENQYAYNNRDNTEIVYEYDGERYEAICPSSYDTTLVETIISRGDVEAIVTGHDHNNTYMYNYMGVKLCSAPTISRLGYSHSEAREGARIFDLNLATIDNIVTRISYINEKLNPDNYEDLETNVTLESFEGTSPQTGVAALGGGGISGQLTLEVKDGVGVDGSSAIEVLRSQTSNAELYIYFSDDVIGKLGENKYLVVWMDFTNVEFRKACTGLLYQGGNVPYMTDNDDGTTPPYYYLADGETEWQSFKHGGDGCFGVKDGGGINGKKGYFAFAVEDFLVTEKGAAITPETLVTGFYMYLDINDNSYANVPFYIDNIMLVEDYNSIN